MDIVKLTNREEKETVRGSREEQGQGLIHKVHSGMVDQTSIEDGFQLCRHPMKRDEWFRQGESMAIIILLLKLPES